MIDELLEKKRKMIYSLVEVRIVIRVQHDEDADLQDIINEADYVLEYHDVDGTIINTEIREVNELGECDEHGTLIVEQVQDEKRGLFPEHEDVAN